MSGVSVEVGGMQTEQRVESVERDRHVAQRVLLVFETDVLEGEKTLPDAVELVLVYS